MHLQSGLEVLVFIRYCGETTGYQPIFGAAPNAERESFLADRNSFYKYRGNYSYSHARSYAADAENREVIHDLSGFHDEHGNEYLTCVVQYSSDNADPDG